MFSLQKMPNGQFSVLAENGAAVGSLTGSKGEWIAIARNEAIGAFESQEAAASAILGKLEITSIFDQMRIVIEDSSTLLMENRHQFFMHTQAQVQQYRCATDLIWIPHEKGSTVVPLDLPSSQEEMNAALASTEGRARELYVVDAASLTMYPTDLASIQRRLSRTPLYKLNGKQVWKGQKRLGSVRITQPHGYKASDRKCQVEISCEVEPSPQEAAALSKIGFIAPQIIPGRDVFSQPIRVEVLYKSQKPFSWKLSM